MAIIADMKLACGARVRIDDSCMDKTPEGRQRVWNNFWRVVETGLARQLEAGVSEEELIARIERGNEEARRERARGYIDMMPTHGAQADARMQQ